MISTIEPVINHLSLPSKTNSLLILEKWINSICDTFSISEEQYGNILIAVTEAVNNAIIHGNKSELEKNAFVKYLYKDLIEETFLCNVLSATLFFDNFCIKN